MMKKRWFVASALLVLAAGALLFGCDSDGDSPGSHLALLGAAAHLDGYTDPLVNCTSCHGSMLRGGEGPSCYNCHNTSDHNTVRNRHRHRHGSGDSCTGCHGPGNGGGLGPACSNCH